MIASFQEEASHSRDGDRQMRQMAAFQKVAAGLNQAHPGVNEVEDPPRQYQQGPHRLLVNSVTMQPLSLLGATHPMDII